MIIVVSNLNHARQFGFSTTVQSKDHPDVATAGESYQFLFIKPGANFFEREAEQKWLRIREGKENKKEIDRLVDEGKFTITESKPLKAAKGKSGKEDAGVPGDLKVFDAKMAIEIVKGSADAANLERWLKEEDRETVVQAIRTQLKYVKQIDKQRLEAQEAQG